MELNSQQCLEMMSATGPLISQSISLEGCQILGLVSICNTPCHCRSPKHLDYVLSQLARPIQEEKEPSTVSLMNCFPQAKADSLSSLHPLAAGSDSPLAQYQVAMSVDLFQEILSFYLQVAMSLPVPGLITPSHEIATSETMNMCNCLKHFIQQSEKSS